MPALPVGIHADSIEAAIDAGLDPPPERLEEAEHHERRDRDGDGLGRARKDGWIASTTITNAAARRAVTRASAIVWGTIRSMSQRR